MEINDEGRAVTSSFFVKRIRRAVERFGRFYPDKLREAAIYLCAAGRCFLVAVRRAG